MADRVIRFDCLRCSKRYAVPPHAAGTWLTCGCGRSTKVPRRSTVGKDRESLLDVLVARLAYGLGGLLFGLIIAAGYARLAFRREALEWLPLIPAFFFLLGLVGGESFINWIGRRFREREDG